MILKRYNFIRIYLNSPTEDKRYGYFYYIDASLEAGRIVNVPITGYICGGTELVVTAWINNMTSSKDITVPNINMYLIGENVNEKDPIICINNTLCVNPHQEDAVKELLPKIDLLHIEMKNKKEEKIEKPNDKLIKDISKELDRLKELIAKAKANKKGKATLEKEQEKLIRVLNYLNKANEQEFALTPIWDIAYVNGPDREAFINLIKTTSYFHGYDPDVKLMEENEKLIK